MRQIPLGIEVRLGHLIDQLSELALGGSEARDSQRAVVDGFAQAVGAELALLYLADEAEELLVVEAAGGEWAGRFEKPKGISIQGPELAAVASRSRRTQRSDPGSAQPSPIAPFLEALVQDGVGTFLAVPLLVGDRLIGVLELAFRLMPELDGELAPLFSNVCATSAVVLYQRRAALGQKRALAKLTAIREVPSLLKEGMSFQPLLQRLVAIACELTGAKYGALGVLAEGGEGLSAFFYKGMREDLVEKIGHLPDGKGLLGVPIHTGAPVRIPHIRKDPRSVGFPKHHPEMDSFLAVPLRLGGQVLGNFYLADKQGAPEFSSEDQELMELFGSQAALLVAYARQTERAERERRVLAAVLESSPEGVLYYSKPDGVPAFSNPGAARLLGRPCEQLLLEELRALCTCAREGCDCSKEGFPAWKALAAQAPAEKEVRVRRPDSSESVLRVVAVPVQLEGETGVLLSLLDISHRLELERLREEFSAVVAHDLRNPVNVWLLSLQSMLRTAKADEVTVRVSTLKAMQRSGARLAQMVNDLLDASRLEAGRLELDRAKLELPALVEGLLEQTAATLGEHPISLQVDGLPAPVLADRLRLEQVLVNLLENAAKYSEPLSPISIKVSTEGEGVLLQVADEGFGIPAEELPRLFDRFYQAKRAREQKTGLGLGLYISRGLVEAHGGRVSVRSVPGKGSTFSVWLPSVPRDTAERPSV